MFCKMIDQPPTDGNRMSLRERLSAIVPESVGAVQKFEEGLFLARKRDPRWTHYDFVTQHKYEAVIVMHYLRQEGFKYEIMGDLICHRIRVYLSASL